MAETNGNGISNNNDQLPQMNVLAQYIKDLSFENPNAPRSPGAQQTAPNISIQVNVNARQLTETDFEVNLLLEGSAGEDAGTLFKFDLDYAGIFRIRNVAPTDVHPILMIECPRLLFPFARQIVADAVRSGGFPPLFIDPIDFTELFRQKVAALQASQTAPAQA
jgi:preprotein translocase subunit SecB